MKSLMTGLIVLFTTASAHAGFWDSIQYDCTDKQGNTLIVFYRYDYSQFVPRDLIFNGTKLAEVHEGVQNGGSFTFNGDGYSLTFVGEAILNAEIDEQSYNMTCARNWWPTIFSL